MQMTDQERLAEVRNRILEAAERVVLLPVSRTIGANYAIQADMVVALPIPAWDAILVALDEETNDA